MPVTADECIKAIESAIKEFGSYTYHDKGPKEVMDLYSLVTRFKTMSMSELAGLLNEVLKHEDGETFVSSVLLELQTIPDKQWEELTSYHDLIKYY